MSRKIGFVSDKEKLKLKVTFASGRVLHVPADDLYVDDRISIKAYDGFWSSDIGLINVNQVETIEEVKE